MLRILVLDDTPLYIFIIFKSLQYKRGTWIKSSEPYPNSMQVELIEYKQAQLCNKLWLRCHLLHKRRAWPLAII